MCSLLYTTGLLRDATGNWKATFYFSAAMMFLCAATLSLRSAVLKSEKKRTQKRNRHSDPI